MTRWKKCVLAVLAAASLTGTAAGAAGLSRDVPASAQTQTESRAGSVIRLTNAARQQNGVALLEADSGLARAAAVRAQEISRSFSHTRPGGGSFVSALSESGVVYRNAGENIASASRARTRSCVRGSPRPAIAPISSPAATRASAPPPSR